MSKLKRDKNEWCHEQERKPSALQIFPREKGTIIFEAERHIRPALVKNRLWSGVNKHARAEKQTRVPKLHS